MAGTRRLTLTLCVFSMLGSAQEGPLAWFPLQVGSRRVYEHEWKSGHRNRPEVDRWTTEETITAWVKVPEGLVVLRDVSGQGTNHLGFVVARQRHPYLVHGDCIYVIDDGWDSQARQLRPEYRRALGEGVSPDLCFPLQPGSKWGNNDLAWQVGPALNGVGLFLPAEYAKAIHVFSGHFGSGGWDDVWFQKGVGVVGEHYIHNGTYDEYTKKLRSFSR